MPYTDAEKEALYQGWYQGLKRDKRALGKRVRELERELERRVQELDKLRSARGGAGPERYVADREERSPVEWVALFAEWARDTLRVPVGHPLAGKPFLIPEFAREWFVRALDVQTTESFLCLARKNGKSAIIAAYMLCRLASPLARPGWRGVVASVSKEKAAELLRQMEQLAEASKLDGLTFRRSPAPGWVHNDIGGQLDILSADRAAGHALGADDAVVDELGLLPERSRELVSGLRSSVSARGGRFWSISVRGDGPMAAEMIERCGAAGSNIVLYAAPDDCRLDDPLAWAAANPGLGTIKTTAYMAKEAARVMETPADQAAFMAFDLNLPLHPASEMLCSVEDWTACETEALPPREGPCVLGFDLGGSSSMTAAVAIWPATWRTECWAAFPAVPPLRVRGRDDGVGGRYADMERRGELWVLEGRVTPVGAFLSAVAADLDGTRVVAAGADRWRRAEAVEAMESAGVRWPIRWRGAGGATGAHGSEDVRAAQRLVTARKLRVRPSLLLRSAIGESTIKRDELGNPKVVKTRSRARIDPVSALTIAAGLAERHAARKPRRIRSAICG